MAIADALSMKEGKPLPWATVRAAIDGAFHGRLLERTVDSGPWPCDYTAAAKVKLKPRSSPPPPPPPPPPPGLLVASSYLKPGEIQELADQIGQISSAAVGYDLRIQVRIEVGSAANRPPDELVGKLNAKLAEVSKDLKLGG